MIYEKYIGILSRLKLCKLSEFGTYLQSLDLDESISNPIKQNVCDPRSGIEDRCSLVSKDDRV